MPTPEQLAANQSNAQGSTGPRTRTGKARVARNAVQHGLRGNFQLIVGESLTEYQTFHDSHHHQLAPCGALENEFAERVIAAFWRLRRINRMETEMIDKVLEDALREKQSIPTRAALHPIDTIFGADLTSPEHDLNSISLGEAVARHLQTNDVIGKLHRYEAHIERGLYRALHELQRLQAVRQGQTVPAPLALDITTSPSTEQSS